MNDFEFFTKLTHPSKRLGWAETTAYFTGKKGCAVEGDLHSVMTSVR